MNKMKYSLFVILLLSFFTSGCVTYTASIKDSSGIYSAIRREGAPKIIITDLHDLRGDKKKVGRIGALDFKSGVAINAVLTDRIASKFGEEGFNVQKISLKNKRSKSEIINALEYNNGEIFLSGGLNDFFVASFDAILEKAKGKVTFFIEVWGKDGKKLFDKKYTSHSEKYVGLAVPSGVDKSIELSLDACVEDLFNDREFLRLINDVMERK